MSKVPEAANFTLSRRQLMWLAGLSTLGLGLGLEASEASEQSGVHEQIDRISRAVESIRAETPDLIGFQDASPVISDAFSGRSLEETDLLLGRLYYDAYERLSRTSSIGLLAPDLSQENIRRVLSNPLPVGGFSRAYFDALLSDTKARAEADAGFHATIEASAEIAKAREGCDCTINGQSAPCWMCIVVIVVIVVVLL